MSEQLGTQALISGLKENLPYLAEHLPDLPRLAVKSLERIANDDLHVEYRAPQLDEIRREIRRANRRSIRAIIGGSFVLSASIILALDGLAPIMIGGGQWLVPLASAAFFIPGLYLLISSYFEE